MRFLFDELKEIHIFFRMNNEPLLLLVEINVTLVCSARVAHPVRYR